MSVTISIDQRPLTVDKGMTILEAARQNGIYIPTLCDYPGLASHGSCRMCIVEIQGRHTTPTACTTPVEEGMVVNTNSPKVKALRADVLQMLLSEHPSSCLFCPEKNHCDDCMVTLRKACVTTGCRSCPKDEQCDLQDMVNRLGIPQGNFPVRYRMLPVEKNDPFIDRDNNLCILCGRCIRICESLHFSNTLTYTQRGTYSLVGTAFNRTLLEAGCSFCGACVEACPTGALTEKTRKWDGKPEKFTVSTCPLCSIGCQINLLTKNDRVIGSLPDHRSKTNVLCVKGRFGITELVNHPTRLKQPQKFSGQHWIGISWNVMIQIAADKLTACAPKKFEMVISANCSNEDLFVADKFVREVMKSDRIRSSARNSGGILGAPGKSFPLSILQEASTILCLGLDGDYAHSVVEVEIHRAKDKGAKVISIDPYAARINRFADVWLQPIPGKETDLVVTLAEITQGTSTIYPGQIEMDRVSQAARLLHKSNSTVIIIGPSFLSSPENTQLIETVERLANQFSARIIALPEQGNLVGSLLQGISPHKDGSSAENLDVLYLIGEAIPASMPGQTAILYQNIYPPAADVKADLILPITAFTEEQGTYTDYSGCVREIHPAAPPPGEALHSWEILCRIARKMGARGFEYARVEEIQADMRTDPPPFVRPVPAVDRKQYQDNPLTPKASEHSYMGFPLTRWVEGLRMLYPGETE